MKEKSKKTQKTKDTSSRVKINNFFRAKQSSALIPAFLDAKNGESFTNPSPEAVEAKCRLKTINGELVPAKAKVIKAGRKFFWQSPDGKRQVYLARNIPERQVCFYNRKKVPADLQVFGEASKHSHMYVVKGSKRVPVFSKANLRKFQFTYGAEASQAIPRSMDLIIEDSNVYALSGNTSFELFYHRTGRRSDCLPEKASLPSVSSSPSKEELRSATPPNILNSDKMEDDFSPFCDSEGGSPVLQKDCPEVYVYNLLSSCSGEPDLFKKLAGEIANLSAVEDIGNIDGLLDAVEEAQPSVGLLEYSLFAGSDRNLVEFETGKLLASESIQESKNIQESENIQDIIDKVTEFAMV